MAEETITKKSKAAEPHIILYGYWRSSSAWRVRIALCLKGIEYETKVVNLLKGEHKAESYLALNPMGYVPVLQIDDFVLSQSLAIIEYLEERWPEHTLFPPKEDHEGRAFVREFANLVASSIHPLQNLSVLNKVAKDCGEDAKKEWASQVISTGLAAFEKLLEKTSGKFCYGDNVTLADLCLVPQLYNARRFGVDLSKFPRCLKIEAACIELEAFKKSAPDAQPDAVPAA